VELSRGANAELLRLAQNRELCGFLDDAAKGYEAAAVIAERQGNRAVLAAALRHRAVLHHHASESHEAARLCRRSYELAETLGHEGLAAEAINTLGGVELETGELDLARHTLDQALALAGRWDHVQARVEQNLGIVANVRGDLPAAAAHYGRSLQVYRRVRDRKGCAIAYHNLGIVSGDQHVWEDADRYFRLAYGLSRKLGDLRPRDSA
jgi:tetratricopeptide (TPR) repeat protein